MHKTCAEVAYFVADGLQLGKQLVDTKRAERVAALKAADVCVGLRVTRDVRVQNMSQCLN